jgi:hypothetical protein
MSRRGHAAFQLCICYISGFGVYSSRIKASEHLCHAVSLQYPYAQHLFYRLQTCFSGQFSPNSETIQWLVDGMSSQGFTRHIAAQDLAQVDMERYLSTENGMYIIDPLTHCIVEDTPLDFTDLQSLVSSVSQLRRPYSSILIGNHQNTLLHLVVVSGSFDATRFFLREFKIDINTCNALGETPLVKACQMGNRQMVELLISEGAKYISNSKEKTSPLHYLLRFHDIDTVEVARLLANAMYPIDMNIGGSRTPLYWAIFRRTLRGIRTGRARRNLIAVKALVTFHCRLLLIV